MSKSLFLQAIVKFALGAILVGTCIFVPAGSLKFMNGWLFMGVLLIPMFLTGLVMLLKNPDLLKRRLNAKESLHEQKTVVHCSGLMFLAGFAVAGLGFRSGWYILPKGIAFGAAAVFLAAYLLYAEVLKENAYLSRTIEVQEGQHVIDTGLYGIVRHPMYSATLLLFLTMPLILGSVYAFFIFLVYPFLIAQRIKSEEAFLERELEGYRAYKARVKYRLIPFIW